MVDSVVTVRMDKGMLDQIDEIARRDRSDRASVLRRLISDALDRHRLKAAVQAYRDGKATTERAAETAGVSVHEMIETLRREGVAGQLSVEEIRHDAARVLRRMGKGELADAMLKG